MTKGYWGKILKIDLSTGQSESIDVADDVYEKYLTGQGIGVWYLGKNIPAGADPLGPENILGFIPGMLTGTGALFAGRWSVVGKSPLTGGWGDANCGGTFAPAIKRCGFDAIFVHGASKTPVYIYVDDHGVEIKDASIFWGRYDAVEAELKLQELEQVKGKTPSVAVIGAAGENLSLISGVCNDRGRIAARSGLGAVMGSKNLKAIVLNGKKRIPVVNSAEVQKLSKYCNRYVLKGRIPSIVGSIMGYAGILMRKSPLMFAMNGVGYGLVLKKYGTSSMDEFSVAWRDSPIKNWKGSHNDFPLRDTKSVAPNQIIAREEVKYHCHSCPLGCGGICNIEGPYKETHKPEYETVLAFGGLCLNKDANSIFYLNELFNRAGMDTISGGSAIAFAIECNEQGLLSQYDFEGHNLTWGNAEAIVWLAEKMIKREGLGAIFTDGVKKGAERIGGKSFDFAIHAGGQEPAMHDGRSDVGFSLHYSVEPTPGRHTIGCDLYYDMLELWRYDKSLPEKKLVFLKNRERKASTERARRDVAMSNFMSLVNSSGLCLFGMFLGVKRTPIFLWLNAVTGWRYSPADYMKIGYRVQTAKQLFNVKHGVKPVDNIISERAYGKEKYPNEINNNEGRQVELADMVRNYWQAIGWNDETGVPLESTLENLNLNFNLE